MKSIKKSARQDESEERSTSKTVAPTKGLKEQPKELDLASLLLPGSSHSSRLGGWNDLRIQSIPDPDPLEKNSGAHSSILSARRRKDKCTPFDFSTRQGLAESVAVLTP